MFDYHVMQFNDTGNFRVTTSPILLRKVGIIWEVKK